MSERFGRPLKIVLTGGPCAGKTCCLRALEESLGSKVVTVPEASTMVLAEGWGAERSFLHSFDERCRFQGRILEVQQRLEAEAEDVACKQSAQVVLCDRGFLDGAAYWPEGRAAYLEQYQLDLQQCLDRYHGVIHLESLAVGRPQRYGAHGNEQRYEDLGGALKIEAAVKQAWDDHPRRAFVSSLLSMEEASQQVIQIMRSWMAECSQN